MPITTESVLAAFAESYPTINPRGIFCLVTGAQIGLTDDTNLDELIQSMPDLDCESRADDLAVRIFATMRPSMGWSKFRLESLDEMRKRQPVNTLAYLLNRGFNPPNGPKNILQLHQKRIELNVHLQTLVFDQFATDLTCALLEIDLRLGLPNFSLSTEIDAVLACDSWQTIVALLTSDVKLAQNRINQLSEEARWNRANPLARLAFAHSFIESGAITRPHEISKLTLRENNSVKAAKVRAKTAENAFFESIFAEIGRSDSTQRIPQAVLKPRPRLRLLGAKRESN